MKKIQGKDPNQRKDQRKKLIEYLAKTREDHNINLLKDNAHKINDFVEGEAKTFFNTVDPNGPFGIMMRKVAPDHVALSDEEIYKLLKSDMLSKINEKDDSEIK